MPFSRDNFACKCCGKNNVDDKVVELCKQIEQSVGMPLTINSGYRCETHNRAVGGKPNSEHTKGKAVDITCASISKLTKVCETKWQELAIGGFGKYSTFCHVDIGSHRKWAGA